VHQRGFAPDTSCKDLHNLVYLRKFRGYAGGDYPPIISGNKEVLWPLIRPKIWWRCVCRATTM